MCVRFHALKRLVLILILVLLAGVTGAYIHWAWKRPLSPWGGRFYFQRVELPVPLFRQGDARWSADALGGVPENGTLGSAGCAVAAVAMVFQSYGIETDPQQLNWFLTAVGGYTEEGWIYWERAAWLAPNGVQHVYEDLPSYQLIDSNLGRGNPVIVRVRFSSGVTHFVVIAGKQGFDYLVRDPGAGAAKGYYPLRELGSDIEALRFYEPLPKASPRVAVQH
jgi:peptidase C39-like protein